MDTNEKYDIWTNVNEEDIFEILPQLQGLSISVLTNPDSIVEQFFKGKLQPADFCKDKVDLFCFSDNDRGIDRSLWGCVKDEFYSYLCTNSRHYKDLKTKMGRLEDKSFTALVAAISSYMGNRLGVEGGIVAGFIIILIFSAIKIGKVALCKHLKANA